LFGTLFASASQKPALLVCKKDKDARAQSENNQIFCEILYTIAICICITKYTLFPDVKEYLNSFLFMNPKNGHILDDIPDQSLPALTPLLKHLAEEYWKPVIEPANEEEIALIEDGIKEYRENPSSFLALTERE
jgi:hypothetical protein